jgi:uncharacterized protein (DUF2267 family)
VDDDRFIEIVAKQADVDRDTAERATRAALETLRDRLSPGEARDVAELLPPKARAWMAKESGREVFGAGELVRRVASRAEVDEATAERYAHAVFAALGAVLSRDELRDMASELPRDFDPLIAEAERMLTAIELANREVQSADEFLGRVAERAGLDTDRARRATDAALETLAERITGGEVADIVAQLPDELRAPLERGNERTRGAAERMTLDEFVRRVAEREGVAPDEARGHTRAVFATLREALTPKEFSDMSAQLPEQFAAVMPRP